MKVHLSTIDASDLKIPQAPKEVNESGGKILSCGEV
jgi:hypothetical protein